MTEKRFVELITYTWSKDSHGLFDYESPHLFTSSFKITDSVRFFRKNNDIQALQAFPYANAFVSDQQFSDLFEIQQDPTNLERYFISTNNTTPASKNIDLVVRALKKDGLPAGYEMKVGDIVKIGRVKFLVREVRDANGVIQKIKNVQEVTYLPNNELPDILQDESEIEPQDRPRTEAYCRICLMTNMYPDELDNTLVSPCKCKGSCEYVHLKCLKQWIDSKKSSIENSENICLSFNYKKLSCEICKENFPYALKLDQHEYDIISIKKPTDTPYLILEKIETGRENKGLFLIKASENEIRIGRGHTHQILVSDISVSRSHAFILYKDGKFLLFDNNSKFGTLVQVEQPIEISHEKTILQCGKTVIILSLKKEDISVETNNLAIAEEVMDSPQTPSTSNEQDIESKVNKSSEIRPKKTGRRAKKVQRATNIALEESKEAIINEGDQIDIIDVDEEETSSGLVQGSKKIFKATKLDNLNRNVALDNNDNKKRQKKGRRG